MITQYCAVYYNPNTETVEGYITSGAPFPDDQDLNTTIEFSNDVEPLPVSDGVSSSPVLPLEVITFEVDVDEDFRDFGLDQVYLDHDAIHGNVVIDKNTKKVSFKNPIAKVKATRECCCKESSVKTRLGNELAQKINAKGQQKAQEVADTLSQAYGKPVRELDKDLKFTELAALKNGVDAL